MTLIAAPINQVPEFEHRAHYEEFLRSVGVSSTYIYSSKLNALSRGIGRPLQVADLASERAVGRTMQLLPRQAVADASRKSIHCAARKYAAMVETNYRSLFALAPVRAAHLPEFQEWVVEEDRKADATAHKYSRFLTRAAEHYEVPIHERTLAHEFDVNRIVSRISEVVARRGRWADGTFNAHDITDNLIPALHAYVCFAKAKYPASREIIMEANDVPQGKIPQGVRQEISRLVRDTKMSQEIKALHEYTCQLCGIRMALRPGEFYAEGHHLKPLGRPHNGEDVPENVVCVCPNCHVLLDYNVVPITLGTLRLVPGHTVGRDYVDYHNAHCR